MKNRFSFSEMQKMKNGVTPKMIASRLSEFIKDDNLKSIGLAIVDKNGEMQSMTWIDGEDDDKEKLANNWALIGSCELLARMAEGIEMEGMDDE